MISGELFDGLYLNQDSREGEGDEGEEDGAKNQPEGEGLTPQKASQDSNTDPLRLATLEVNPADMSASAHNQELPNMHHEEEKDPEHVSEDAPHSAPLEASPDKDHASAGEHEEEGGQHNHVDVVEAELAGSNNEDEDVHMEDQLPVPEHQGSPEDNVEVDDLMENDNVPDPVEVPLDVDGEISESENEPDAHHQPEEAEVAPIESQPDGGSVEEEPHVEQPEVPAEEPIVEGDESTPHTPPAEPVEDGSPDVVSKSSHHSIHIEEKHEDVQPEVEEVLEEEENKLQHDFELQNVGDVDHRPDMMPIGLQPPSLVSKEPFVPEAINAPTSEINDDVDMDEPKEELPIDNEEMQNSMSQDLDKDDSEGSDIKLDNSPTPKPSSSSHEHSEKKTSHKIYRGKASVRKSMRKKGDTPVSHHEEEKASEESSDNDANMPDVVDDVVMDEEVPEPEKKKSPAKPKSPSKRRSPVKSAEKSKSPQPKRSTRMRKPVSPQKVTTPASKPTPSKKAISKPKTVKKVAKPKKAKVVAEAPVTRPKRAVRSISKPEPKKEVSGKKSTRRASKPAAKEELPKRAPSLRNREKSSPPPPKKAQKPVVEKKVCKEVTKAKPKEEKKKVEKPKEVPQKRGKSREVVATPTTRTKSVRSSKVVTPTKKPAKTIPAKKSPVRRASTLKPS